MSGPRERTVRTEHHDADDLADALATRVAADLAKAVEGGGAASMAVPGGATPAAFLTALGRTDLPWQRITVTLTDERWAPAGHARSNQRLLCETLLAGRAAAARFVPLYTGAPEARMAVAGVSAALAAHLPLTVAVLGMGEDGHTASLFAGAPQLDAALDPACPDAAMAVSAPGQPEARITLSLPVLAGAAHVYLLTRGAAKRAALERAMAADPRHAPVRAVLDAARDPVVFHAD